MIRKRIFSVILAVLLVITCASEAMFIKFLQNDKNEMEQEIENLKEQADTQGELLEFLAAQVDGKANASSIRLFLPEDIYVCEKRGADIYNSSVVYGINLNSYAFHWECPIGNSRNDRFEIPAMCQAGDYEVTLKIYDLELNELTLKTSVLHIIPDIFAEAGALNMDNLNPMIYAAENDDIPEYLDDYLENVTESSPGVVIIFPSVYEVYADLDSTLKKASNLVEQIRTQYSDVPILFVEPAYPGSNAEEEARPDEEGNQTPRWAYAEKTMIFNLISEFEAVYAEDETVWVVPNALMTNSETSSDKVGDAIYGMLCRFVMENKTTMENESVSDNGQ